MSQGEMHDDFLNQAIAKMDDNITDEQLEAITATEKQHPGAIGALYRIGDRVRTGFTKFMASDGMNTYTQLTKEVALDEAERRFAEILQRTFWELIEKYLGGIDIKAVQWLIHNPYGRAATMAIIAIPISGLLTSRVEHFSNKGNDRYAKICLFLSRVVAKMSLIDGMAAFSIDKLIDKAVGAIVGVAEKEGANLEDAIAHVSDQQVQEARKNHKYMKR